MPPVSSLLRRPRRAVAAVSRQPPRRPTRRVNRNEREPGRFASRAFCFLLPMSTRRIATLLLLSAAFARPADAQKSEAVFAGGCFWGVQWVFEHVRGVTAVVSGYSGGSVPNPTYELVGMGRTGHAESVLVTYDSTVVSYRQLLDIFFRVAHDPTTRDRQGPDVGSDY